MVLFSAELTDFKVVYNVLNAVSCFNEFAVVRPMQEGIKFLVQQMKSIETIVYIPCSMFDSYNLENEEEDIIFKISLKSFAECLNIFGDDGDPSLKLTYSAHAAPLQLLLKHGHENIIIDGEIKTLTVDDFSSLGMNEECSRNKVVMEADTFLDVLLDADCSEADEMELTISPTAPHFRVQSWGVLGESTIDIPKHSDALLMFQCESKTMYKYTYKNFKQVIKVLEFANKISISTGENGLLGMQLVIYTDDQKQRQIFIEYYVCSLFETD